MSRQLIVKQLEQNAKELRLCLEQVVIDKAKIAYEFDCSRVDLEMKARKIKKLLANNTDARNSLARDIELFETQKELLMKINNKFEVQLGSNGEKDSELQEYVFELINHRPDTKNPAVVKLRTSIFNRMNSFVSNMAGGSRPTHMREILSDLNDFEKYTLEIDPAVYVEMCQQRSELEKEHEQLLNNMGEVEQLLLVNVSNKQEVIASTDRDSKYNLKMIELDRESLMEDLEVYDRIVVPKPPEGHWVVDVLTLGLFFSFSVAIAYYVNLA